MKEQELQFDHSRHLMYSRAFAAGAREYLTGRYGPERGEQVWQTARQTYARFLGDLPDIGGSRNRQAMGVYDSIAILAVYEAEPEKPTLEELEAFNNAVFCPAYERLGFVNLNHPLLLRLAHRIFSMIQRLGEKGNWPGNYRMEVAPFDREMGIRYQFHTCPIADFARSHGYTHLMPALCNADYPMLKSIHAGLIRTHTCANGDCCDYWILGDQSPLLKEHPCFRDEAGYLRNK